MGLFSRTKTDTKVAVDTKKEAVKKASTVRTSDRNLSGVLIKPQVTEKAVRQSEQSTYSFIVHQNATKYDVRDAVAAFYNVTPIAVRIINRPATRRHVGSRNRKEKVSGQKKAYVQLKKGESITLV
jgi:ribosomal protein L23